MLVTLVEFFLNEEGRERFPAWVHKLGELTSRCPGFVDARQLTPLGESDRTVFMLVFDTEEDTQRWVDSPDRQDLLARIIPYWTKQSQPRQFLAGESLPTKV